MMRVHHVGYLVKHLAPAQQAFARLGYTETSPAVYDPDRDADIAFWTLGTCTVELVCPRSERSVVAGLLKKFKNTPYHLCYETDDLEGELKRLENAGFMRIDDPAAAPAVPGEARVAFLYSAQIGLIELLTQRP